ncbi:hypothetical protein [Ornithinimicrobium avium]|uniref:Uncharacterized protein n=1 Tax=Ornithinimicrobium avium TaxID=2283195 RepID=A0A345NP64_9MICO|nr:hypothetical protein [Ornithinimicrobium avium]AXH96822.1 hypothetical protein DV701_12475 [Ornithinimicrobium avium]
MSLGLPHPHLLTLRLAATLLLSAVVGQAGWAAAVLGGEPGYARFHEVGAWVTLGLSLLCALVYVVLRRSAGPVNLWLAVGLAVAVSVQFGLGQAGQRALHIFGGVLVAMVATALTSWTYRHQLPATGRPGGS